MPVDPEATACTDPARRSRPETPNPLGASSDDCGPIGSAWTRPGTGGPSSLRCLWMGGRPPCCQTSGTRGAGRCVAEPKGVRPRDPKGPESGGAVLTAPSCPNIGTPTISQEVALCLSGRCGEEPEGAVSAESEGLESVTVGGRERDAQCFLSHGGVRLVGTRLCCLMSAEMPPRVEGSDVVVPVPKGTSGVGVVRRDTVDARGVFVTCLVAPGFSIRRFLMEAACHRWVLGSLIPN